MAQHGFHDSALPLFAPDGDEDESAGAALTGKLPSYIMPCLLPLALLMGHTLSDLLRNGRARQISRNGLLNFVIGMVAMVGLIYLQIARPLYSNSHAESAV